MTHPNSDLGSTFNFCNTSSAVSFRERIVVVESCCYRREGVVKE